MDGSAVIVTAWDAPDGTFLSGLLGSIAAVGAGGRAVRVFVPGAAEADAVRLMQPSLGVVAVPLGGAGDGFSARIADTLPLLPQIVHGFSRYVWIDPAVWVVGEDAFTPYDEGAGKGALAGAYELDRSYRIFASARTPWRDYRSAYTHLFGAGAAKRMGFRAIVNTGMFALPGNAPHWAAWREAFGSLDREARTWTESHLSACQLALNLAVVRDRLPVAPLPALWNWLCHWERPFWNGERLVEPEPPYAPIRVIHLAGQARRRDMTIIGSRGGAFRSSLRFPLVVEAAGPKAA